jgi:glutaminyl-peptide cyclotransferase
VSKHSHSRPSEQPSPPSRRRFARQLWGTAAVLACGAGVGAWWLWSRSWADASKVPNFGFEEVKSYPHDPQAFTQGLVFHEDGLYESTGLEGQSSLRRVELETGKVLDRVNLDARLFGEGLALVEDELFQLTWQNGVCLVYDRKTLRKKRTHQYEGEGWGLAFDGKHLILSDGSFTLRFLDPKTFRVEHRVVVTLGGKKLGDLNELEYVNGEVWANVWFKDYLARIDPKTGKVNSVVDLAALWPWKQRTDDGQVLNGIAHDPKGKRLFVTGKNWPKLHEIRVVAR